MTEFDRGAFSAVDAFFGANEDEQNITNSSEITPDHSKQSKRMGIGAVKKFSSTDRSIQKEREENVKNLVLKKTQKRKRNQDENEEEEYDESDKDEKEIEEDEEGRTSVIKDRDEKPKPISLTKSVTDEYSTAGKKKKKKKGKKERQKDKEFEQIKQDGKTIESSLLENQTPTVMDPTADETSAVNEEDINIEKPKRKKRPKIRSKQKNIRKDTRSLSIKPSELNPNLPGHLYHGRPLTKETREILQLKPKIKKSTNSYNGGDRNEGEGVGLAVDDWLHDGDDNPEDVGVKARNNENSKKKKGAKNKRQKKKKKVSKYKNLA